MKKVVKDGKVAVLYSPNYGAGWYSWNKGMPHILFSPEIVNMLLNEEEVTPIKCEEIFGEEGYFGGYDGLTIEWLPKGTQFRISEHDGYESIEIVSEISYITA